VRRVLAAEAAELLLLHPVGVQALVLLAGIITTLTIPTSQSYDLAHLGGLRLRLPISGRLLRWSSPRILSVAGPRLRSSAPVRLASGPNSAAVVLRAVRSSFLASRRYTAGACLPPPRGRCDLPSLLLAPMF